VPLRLDRLGKHPVLVEGRIEIPKAEIHNGGRQAGAGEAEQKLGHVVGIESGVIVMQFILIKIGSKIKISLRKPPSKTSNAPPKKNRKRER